MSSATADETWGTRIFCSLLKPKEGLNGAPGI
jgi:hypothetical protein